MRAVPVIQRIVALLHSQQPWPPGDVALKMLLCPAEKKLILWSFEDLLLMLIFYHWPTTQDGMIKTKFLCFTALTY